MKIRLSYIISKLHKSLAFEWLATHFDRQHYELQFILLHERDSSLEQFLRRQGFEVYRVRYRSKKDLPAAFWQVRKLLKKHQSQIVHAHLFDAALIGLLAAKSLGIGKRIYTRHYATLHHEYFPRAVYYDRFINALATHSVAISTNVAEVLQDLEKVPAHKIVLIPHGFQLADFREIPEARIKALRQKYIPEGAGPVIGVIARWTHCKGIQYIIPAFAALREQYPQAFLLLANAQGDYAATIFHSLQSLSPESYVAIPFEEDIAALYHLMQLYVHVPINPRCEAFGQTYIEALAAGVPSVFTLSGIAREFIKDGENALTVPFEDEKAILEAMQRLLAHPQEAQAMAARAQSHLEDNFGIHLHLKRLYALYQS